MYFVIFVFSYTYYGFEIYLKLKKNMWSSPGTVIFGGNLHPTEGRNDWRMSLVPEQTNIFQLTTLQPNNLFSLYYVRSTKMFSGGQLYLIGGVISQLNISPQRIHPSLKIHLFGLIMLFLQLVSPNILSFYFNEKSSKGCPITVQ